MFEVPNGLAAGGITGFATVIRAVVLPFDLTSVERQINSANII